MTTTPNSSIINTWTRNNAVHNTLRGRRMNQKERIIAIETAQQHINIALDLLKAADVNVRHTFTRDLKNDLEQEIWDIQQEAA